MLLKAVSHYWLTRRAQKDKQKKRGVSDAGLRSAVTGGAQMDGFIRLFRELIVDSGIDSQYIYEKKALELPGFLGQPRSGTYWLLKMVSSLLLLKPNPR